MPDGNQHIRQSAHNIQFLESFFKDRQYNDWSITVAFYIVVHIMENAIFATQDFTYRGNKVRLLHSGDLKHVAPKFNIDSPENYSVIPFSDHIARKIIIEENFPDIADEYMISYRNSQQSRYYQYLFPDYTVDLMLKKVLLKIIDWSNKRFSTAFKLNLK